MAVVAAARVLAVDRPIGVIPAGERWPDGSLRPAIEDLLGAGAILSHLNLPCSPETQVAIGAYRSADGKLADLIRASLSGRELIDAGYRSDVEMALEQNVSSVAPTPD